MPNNSGTDLLDYNRDLSPSKPDSAWLICLCLTRTGQLLLGDLKEMAGLAARVLTSCTQVLLLMAHARTLYDFWNYTKYMYSTYFLCVPFGVEKKKMAVVFWKFWDQIRLRRVIVHFDRGRKDLREKEDGDREWLKAAYYREHRKYVHSLWSMLEAWGIFHLFSKDLC